MPNLSQFFQLQKQQTSEKFSMERKQVYNQYTIKLTLVYNIGIYTAIILTQLQGALHVFTA